MKMSLSDIAGSNGIFIDGDWIVSKDQDSNGAVRLIQLADIGEGVFNDKSSKFVTEETAGKLHCTMLQKGDILISRLGKPLCKSCVFPLNGKYITAVDVVVLRVGTEDISKSYIVYLLNSPWFKKQVKEYESGTTRKRISRKNLDKIYFEIPTLSEQERIVARIEEMFSEVDAGVEALKTAKAQLAVYRQSVLKEAFASTGSKVAFGIIMESRLGKMLDNEKNTGIPRRYLRNKNVRWLSFDLKDLLEMRIEDNEIDKYSIKKGDLVICEGGEPGRCAVWIGENGIFYQKALHRIRFTDGSSPTFYMYYLWFAAQTGLLKPYFTGTGIKHLTEQSLVKLPVPTASRGQQDSIVDKIEARLSVCDSIEQTVDTILQQSKSMKQCILKKAFEGRL